MYQGPDSREVANIAGHDEGYGQNMMRKHLPVVVPSFLIVNHEYLVKPPSELGEVVKFGERGKMEGWVGAPELLGGSGVGDLPKDALDSISPNLLRMRGRRTMPSVQKTVQ